MRGRTLTACLLVWQSPLWGCTLWDHLASTQPELEPGQHSRNSHIVLAEGLDKSRIGRGPLHTAESRLCKRHLFVNGTGKRESLLAEPWAILNPLQCLQWSIGTCSSKIRWAARSLVGLAAIVVPSDRMMAAGPALLTPKTKQNDLPLDQNTNKHSKDSNRCCNYALYLSTLGSSFQCSKFRKQKCH